MGYAAINDQAVYDLVERANAARLGGVDDADSRAAEAACREIFGSESRIAVYGALAPGEARHYMLSPFRGVWTTGFIRGRLERKGFAGALGLEALALEGGAERVPVHLLTAAMLATAWDTLSIFTVRGVARLLAPVEDADGVSAVANVFASTE